MKKDEILALIKNMSNNATVDFGIPEYTNNNTFYIVRKSKNKPFNVKLIDLLEMGITPNFISSFNGKDEIVCRAAIED